MTSNYEIIKQKMNNPLFKQAMKTTFNGLEIEVFEWFEQILGYDNYQSKQESEAESEK